MKIFREPLVLIFALVGLAFLVGAGAYALHLNEVANHWPRVDALIVESKLVSERANYKGLLLVRYRVAGKDYEKIIDTGVSSSIHDLAQSSLADYPVNEHRMLPVNPGNPEDIRTRPGTADFILVGGLVGGGLLFLFIPVGVVALSERKDAIRLTGFAFVGIGVLFVLLGIGMGWGRSQVLRSWPSTEATVIASGIGGGGRRSWMTLELSYTVDGRPIQVRTGSSWSTGTPGSLKKVLSFWSPGSKHLVYYRQDQADVVDFEAEWGLSYFWPAAILILVGSSTTLLGALVVRYLGRN